MAAIYSSRRFPIPKGIGRLLNRLNPGSSLKFNGAGWKVEGRLIRLYCDWLCQLVGDPLALPLFRLVSRNTQGKHKVIRKGVLMVSDDPITEWNAPVPEELALKVAAFAGIHRMAPEEVLLACTETVFGKLASLETPKVWNIPGERNDVLKRASVFLEQS